MEQLVYRNEGKNRTKNVCVSPSVSVQSEPRDDRHHSYYVYDHTGERVVKLTGETSIIDCNAEVQETKALLDNATVYPSPYMVLNNKGYTKHYYAGAERVAARIGTGGLGYIAPCAINDYEAQSRASKLFESANRQIDEAVSGNDEFLRAKIENIYGEPMDIGNFNPKELPVALKPYVKASTMELFRSVKYNSSDTTPSGASVAIEPEVFFYHSDHLGSASWITNGGGEAVQHLQYLPFGEPYVNQRTSSYNERFTFTGKERDEETGYSYFSARYLDHTLLTGFLSVDRYASKYPSISPYAYCAWNPIRLTDPSGDTVILSNDAQEIHNQYYNVNKEYTEMYDQLHSCEDKLFVVGENGYTPDVTNSTEGGTLVQYYPPDEGDDPYENFAGEVYSVQWRSPHPENGGDESHVYLEEMYHAKQLLDFKNNEGTIEKEVSAKQFAIRVNPNIEFTCTDRRGNSGVPTQLGYISSHNSVESG